MIWPFIFELICFVSSLHVFPMIYFLKKDWERIFCFPWPLKAFCMEDMKTFFTTPKKTIHKISCWFWIVWIGFKSVLFFVFPSFSQTPKKQFGELTGLNCSLDFLFKSTSYRSLKHFSFLLRSKVQNIKVSKVSLQDWEEWLFWLTSKKNTPVLIEETPSNFN